LKNQKIKIRFKKKWFLATFCGENRERGFYPIISVNQRYQSIRLISVPQNCTKHQKSVNYFLTFMKDALKSYFLILIFNFFPFKKGLYYERKDC